MNRRHILGLGAGLIAAGPSAVPAALNATMANTIANNPSFLLDGISESAGDNPRPLEEMMSAAERLLHREREREADARRSEAEARRWNRQFLHSMSLSARRALDRRDDEAARAARSALWEFLDVIHGRQPNAPAMRQQTR